MSTIGSVAGSTFPDRRCPLKDVPYCVKPAGLTAIGLTTTDDCEIDDEPGCGVTTGGFTVDDGPGCGGTSGCTVDTSSGDGDTVGCFSVTVVDGFVDCVPLPFDAALSFALLSISFVAALFDAT